MFALALFLLFTVVPALETYILIEVGKVIGGWETVGWLIAMGLLGAWLGKRAGTGVIRQIGDDLRAGRSPADSVVEGALVLVGSLLLVTPGILSDGVGLLLFIPSIRRFLAPRIMARVLVWLGGRPGGFAFSAGPIGRGPAAREGAETEATGERAKKSFDHASF